MKKNPVEIQILRGTTSEWESFDNDVNTLRLQDGEFGYDNVAKKLKIGDGFTKFSELPYTVLQNQDPVFEQEGNWDVILSYGSNSFSKQSTGKYHIIGNKVTCWFTFEITKENATTTTSMSAVTIKNLPVVPSQLLDGQKVGQWGLLNNYYVSSTENITFPSFLTLTKTTDGSYSINFYSYDSGECKNIKTLLYKIAMDIIQGTTTSRTIIGSFSYLREE